MKISFYNSEFFEDHKWSKIEKNLKKNFFSLNLIVNTKVIFDWLVEEKMLRKLRKSSSQQSRIRLSQRKRIMTAGSIRKKAMPMVYRRRWKREVITMMTAISQSYEISLPWGESIRSLINRILPTSQLQFGIFYLRLFFFMFFTWFSVTLKFNRFYSCYQVRLQILCFKNRQHHRRLSHATRPGRTGS